MRQLTRLLNAVLNSHSFVKIASGCVVITILTLVLFGPELVKILFANSREVANSASGQIDPQTALSPQSTSYSSANPRGNTSVTDSAPPATSSVDEQLRKLDSEALLSNIGKLSQELAQLNTELIDWNKRTANLATNDSGRKIANSPDCFLPVANLIKSEPTSFEGVVALKNRLRLLGDNALNLRNTNDANALQTQVAIAKEQFEQSRGELDKAVLALDLFEKRCRFVTASSMTLTEAIKQHEENNAIALADELVKKQQAHDKQIADLKREGQAKLNQLSMEQEQQRIEAEKEKLRRDITNEKIEIENAAKKRQLEAEFERDLPQIKFYLAPMLTPGYGQPVVDRGPLQSTTQQTMSLATIRTWCLLSDDTDDLRRDYDQFLRLMTQLSEDRKIENPYPRSGGSASEEQRQAAVRPGYALLQKYQFVLVEKKYLRP